MKFVVVNSRGELYAGFSDSRPVWYKNKRDESVFDEAIADAYVKQLTELGFGPVVKRDANNVAKKWVPASLDATA